MNANCWPGMLLQLLIWMRTLSGSLDVVASLIICRKLLLMRVCRCRARTEGRGG